MLTGAGALCAGSLAAVALSTAHTGEWRWPAAVLVWALVGSGSGLVLTPVGRVLRRSAREADRPAVFAAQFSLSHACWLLSYPIAGWLVTATGFTPGWLTLAALTVLGGLAATRLWPRHDPPTQHGPVADDRLAGAEPTGGGGERPHPFTAGPRHPRGPRP